MVKLVDKSTECIDKIVNKCDKTYSPRRYSEFRPFSPQSESKEDEGRRYSAITDERWTIVRGRRSRNYRNSHKQVCFNCRSPNHFAKFCKYPKNKFHSQQFFAKNRIQSNYDKFKQNKPFKLNLQNRFGSLNLDFRQGGVL